MARLMDACVPINLFQCSLPRPPVRVSFPPFHASESFFGNILYIRCYTLGPLELTIFTEFPFSLQIDRIQDLPFKFNFKLIFASIEIRLIFFDDEMIADRSGRHGERRRVRRHWSHESRGRRKHRRSDRTGNVAKRDGVRRLWRTRPRAHCPLRRRSNLALAVLEMLCLCQASTRPAFLLPQGHETLLQARLRSVS